MVRKKFKDEDIICPECGGLKDENRTLCDECVNKHGIDLGQDVDEIEDIIEDATERDID